MATAAATVPAIPYVPPRPRPRRGDPDVKAVAARDLARDLAPWMERNLTEREIADLQSMRLSGNGYELAKEIERRWRVDPDFELVEILEGSWSTLDAAHGVAIAEWVTKNNIALARPIGARVTTEYGPGEITGRDEKHATYCVRPDSEFEKFAGGGGYILAPDDVTASTETI